MIKQFFQTILLLVFQAGTALAGWHYVGTAGFSPGEAENPCLVIDGRGTLYVAYEDWANEGKASVMRFDGTSWVQVGPAGFSLGENRVRDPYLALDGSGTPYVVYEDWSRENKVSVMKFDGENWVQIGAAGFSAGAAYDPSIAISSGGTPYVAYRDDANGEKASVMRFNGTSWEQVGLVAGFTPGVAWSVSLAIDSSGAPYVAYTDAANNGGKANVMKFDGENWMQVGPADFSDGEAASWSASLALDSHDTPYVVYTDAANGTKASVMKFDGENWIQIGSAGFTTGEAWVPGLALDSNDMPYVVYMDGAKGKKASVMRFEGTGWVQVGRSGFSCDTAPWPSLAIDGSDVPYVAYRDDANGGKISVMKFIPSAE